MKSRTVSDGDLNRTAFAYSGHLRSLVCDK